MKNYLLIMCALLLGLILKAQTTETITTANGNWEAKCGITTVDVKAWGAGGGGGRATNTGQTNGAGGGGAFAATTITVSAGDTVPYQVGQGGSGGSNNKDGGQTWFNIPSVLSAAGGKGVPNNTLNGSAGGLVGNSVGTVKYSGGSGGNGTGDGAIHASGGGGGAARITSNGGNGLNGITGNIFFGGTGGAGGTSTSPGGSGGKGAGSDGDGTPGKSFGGGGGGGKRGALGIFNQDGGNGANGAIILSYTLPIGTPSPIQAANSLSSNPGTAIGCNESQVTLTATGGYTGNGVSTLWYEGNSCPSFSYINEFMTNSPSTYINTSATTLNSGNRLFTASTNDPGIDMMNVLSTQVDVAEYKYITVRYRLNSPQNIANGFEIYFNKGNLGLDESRKVSMPLITDGIWHIINIDMSTNSSWNNDANGDIKGWRFDYATVSGSKIEIDYLVLGNVQIAENLNINDATITLSPTELSTTYGAIRISDQEGACNGGIPSTTCTQTNISRIDKTYNVANGNWSTAANWSPGSVLPDLNNCVNIQTGKNIVVDVVDAQAGRLNVENGGTITIPANKVLYVQNGINNNDSSGNNFIVKSDGNLIQLSNATNTGKITVERNVNDMNNISTKMDYVYWSSPVTGQITKGPLGFSPGTPNDRFFTYRESNDRFYETGDPTFVLGKGYAVRAETGTNPDTGLPFTNPYAKDYKFKGVPNNGEISINVVRSPDAGVVQHGFNLVGNPYPSNINFEILYAANSTLIFNNIYFWTNNSFTPNQEGSGYSGNNYAIYTGVGGNPATGGTLPAPTGIIKVGQGFIIQKRNVGGPAPLIFKNSYGIGQDLRVATPGTFYQKNVAPKNRFWLKLISPDDLVNTQLIGYIDGATDGFEQDYDAEIMGMSSDIFYSKLDDKRLLIQGKGDFETTDKVNLGANFFKSGTYTLALDIGEGIFSGSQKVYLKDYETGTLTDLSVNQYSFEAAQGISEGRFEIIYEPQQVLLTDDAPEDNLIVYRDGGDFIVRAQSKNITDLEVYDGSGRLIYKTQPRHTEVRIPGDKLLRGVYILKIDQDGQLTKKKILK